MFIQDSKMADEQNDRRDVQDGSKKERNYKSVKKKTTNFFTAPQQTYYDRALELSFLSRYYRELCLSVMGACMVAFGLALTIIAIDQKISDLYIIGPGPLAIGAVLLIFAIGFTIKRCVDRPRIGMDLHFVESPDRLFLQKRQVAKTDGNNVPGSPETPVTNPIPGPSKNVPMDGKPKSCLRRSSIPANPLRNSPKLNHAELHRKASYTEFPASPISVLPEVGGHDGESIRSTPERPSTAEADPGYPPEGALASASPIDVLPPAEYNELIA